MVPMPWYMVCLLKAHEAFGPPRVAAKSIALQLNLSNNLGLELHHIGRSSDISDYFDMWLHSRSSSSWSCPWPRVEYGSSIAVHPTLGSLGNKRFLPWTGMASSSSAAFASGSLASDDLMHGEKRVDVGLSPNDSASRDVLEVIYLRSRLVGCKDLISTS